MRDKLILDEAQIFSWIEEVFSHGVRRPGYPADRWAESWLQDQFRALGLTDVHAEPVEMQYWEPLKATLTVRSSSGEWTEIPCFQLPHSAPAQDLELDLVAFDAESPEVVRRAASLYDAPLTRLPHTLMRDRLAEWAYDPARTFDHGCHILPFGRELMDATHPSSEAGAAAFIGSLSGYPGNSYEYYVPYDAVARPIPSVWITGSDGLRLRDLLAQGPVGVRLSLEALREQMIGYNIIGELPGPDDETVIIGSHHDGPWSSAVEDSSGIAMVLAQAAYWSQVPQAERPHRLVFLLNSGHMSGGAGQRTYVEQHRKELDRAILELHLEHVAADFTDEGGALHATGEPEVGWWFTSLIPRLQDAVRAAIEAEDIRRSLIVKPTLFGDKPTTDAADFYPAGVPIVNFLAAPFYLFDAMDTLAKIHRPHLVPITRAAIRIIESTAGVSAAEMRAGVAADG
jgi:hypothetical protein